jgi:hypothetical protein
MISSKIGSTLLMMSNERPNRTMPAILLIVAQRYVAGGVTAGAVKD